MQISIHARLGAPSAGTAKALRWIQYLAPIAMMESGRTPRLATVRDADEVARLLHDFNTEFDTPSPGTEVLATRLRTLLTTDQTVAILVGGPPVAVALVTFLPNVWHTGGSAKLDELYVVPTLRGRGIGSAVIAELQSICRRRGVGLIELNVDEGDVDAQRFYEHHGFFSSAAPGSEERVLYYEQELGN